MSQGHFGRPRTVYRTFVWACFIVNDQEVREIAVGFAEEEEIEGKGRIGGEPRGLVVKSFDNIGMGRGGLTQGLARGLPFKGLGVKAACRQETTAAFCLASCADSPFERCAESAAKGRAFEGG